MPSGVPPRDQSAALDSLGGAVQIASGLPSSLGDSLIEAGKTAFVEGLHMTTGITAVVALVFAIVVAALLRGVPARDADAVHAGNQLH
jgi:DHA2 family multidrug resistance protein-like MFS transporter